MKIYHIKQVQFLPASLDQAWSFFADPGNLNEITPPGLQFSIQFISRKEQIYPGQLIGYRIRILPLIWVTWLTEITAVKAGEYFIDDQRNGPYALWHHQHHFREVPGGVEITDEVNYAIPLGWLGQIVHRLFVGPQLQRIFAYRRRILNERFRMENTQEIITV
ncbi:MAG: SRPBCC family protein [Chryseosolibacter sp.]